MKLFDELTERQEDVLTLLAQGLSNREIASRLHISVYTVNNHVQSLFATLPVKNRTEATKKYWQRLSQVQAGQKIVNFD